MDSKSRMLKAWNFEEPDRVPIEMYLYPPAKGLPGADKIQEFQDNEADNFLGTVGFDWGFMGLDSEYSEEVIEKVPGKYSRILRKHSTSAGDFTAITKHIEGDFDPNDYHWEKRYFHTLDDFKRLAKAKRSTRKFDLEAYNNGCKSHGNRGLTCTPLFHPLGSMVRYSNMSEAFMWLLTDENLVIEFQEACAEQICNSLKQLEKMDLVDPPVFMTYALEMLCPPWLGKDGFNKLVFPFDKQVNDTIHAIGGRHRAHCHGNCGEFLEIYADMGIDGVEPLEPSPYGDNVLADAKKRVGKRMLLAGNVVSQDFFHDSYKIEDIRDHVKRAIDEGAPGGGFILKTTGGAVGGGKTREQCIKDIECNLVLIDAWREFSKY